MASTIGESELHSEIEPWKGCSHSGMHNASDKAGEAIAEAKALIDVANIEALVEKVRGTLSSGVSDISSSIKSIGTDSSDAIKLNGVGIDVALEQYSTQLDSTSFDSVGGLDGVVEQATEEFNKKAKEFYSELQSAENSSKQSACAAYQKQKESEAAAAQATS